MHTGSAVGRIHVLVKPVGGGLYGIVRFIVWQRRLHASPPANELSWLLEAQLTAGTQALGNAGDW